jgi:hypothetical protein
MTSKRQGKHVKFLWVDRPNNETLAFEINQDELTGDVALVITDFEDQGEEEEAIQMYAVCVERLRQTIGG